MLVVTPVSIVIAPIPPPAHTPIEVQDVIVSAPVVVPFCPVARDVTVQFPLASQVSWIT